MAGSLNKVLLIGRLGQDPKLAYTAGGTPVCNFSVATDESYLDGQGNKQERTEWHRVVAFAKLAELCSNYLGKGRLVYVEGKQTTRSWEDPQGQKRYTTEVKAQQVTFLDKAPEQPGRQQSAPGQVEPDGADQGPAFPQEAGAMDDVPF